MLRIVSHIEQLLLTHNCVVIPQVGGLVFQYESTPLSADTTQFVPTRRVVVLDPTYQDDDQLLLHTYEAAYGLNEKYARRMLLTDIGLLRSTLQKRGEVLIGINGRLIRHSNGQISFQSKVNETFDLEAYGLPTFQFEKLPVAEEKTEEILKASNQTPQLSIRVNIMKTSVPQLKERLTDLGFEVFDSHFSRRALLVRGSRLMESAPYCEGMFSVQDQASVMVSDMLGAAPGDRVIDVCAAPGGKTFATAELMAGEGVIYAMDKYEHKLKLMEAQSQRAGLNNIRLILRDSRKPDTNLTECADKVLADVPCSGLGVIRRKPEIKYKDNKDMDELILRQHEILCSSAQYVRRGGVLVYSTCTINPAENDEQIVNFLKENGEFRIVQKKQLFPEEGTDGFFMCKMRKE